MKILLEVEKVKKLQDTIKAMDRKEVTQMWNRMASNRVNNVSVGNDGEYVCFTISDKADYLILRSLAKEAPRLHKLNKMNAWTSLPTIIKEVAEIFEKGMPD